MWTDVAGRPSACSAPECVVKYFFSPFQQGNNLMFKCYRNDSPVLYLNEDGLTHVLLGTSSVRMHVSAMKMISITSSLRLT